MVETEFHTPASVEEAIGLLTGLSGGVRLLAGGTDVVVQLNERRGPRPAHLVYLGLLDELRGIELQDRELILGTLVSHARLAADPLVAEAAPLVAAAARRVGGPAIRTQGTIGGNVGTASPAGDVSTALLATGSPGSGAGTNRTEDGLPDRSVCGAGADLSGRG